MTPQEIAAKLTPAQARALRDLDGCTYEDFHALMQFEIHSLPPDQELTTFTELNDLGRAVLACLDGEATP